MNLLCACLLFCLVLIYSAHLCSHNFQFVIIFCSYNVLYYFNLTTFLHCTLLLCTDSDDTDFKLGRFPDFIDQISRIFESQLAPWKGKTEAVLMSYVDMAFQSPLANPHFRLKYTFSRNHQNVMGTNVEMDFDAEALASTIIHTVILRCSIFLTETISVGDVMHFQNVNWTENCAKERGIYLNGLHNVDHVVEQLKEHLELTDEDIISFQRTGSVLPVDIMHMIKSAIENATITGSIHAPSSAAPSSPSQQPVPKPKSQANYPSAPVATSKRSVPQAQTQTQAQSYPQKPQANRSSAPVAQPQPTRGLNQQQQQQQGQTQYPPQPQRGNTVAPQQPYYPPQPGSHNFR